MTETPARPFGGLVRFLPYLLDIVLPLASYATLRALGASTFWALIVSGLLSAATTAGNTIRRGRLDRLGALVLFEVTLGVVLDFVIRDPRLMLARASLYIALGGVWMLINAFTARPLTVDAAKPWAAKAGRPGIAAYEWAAANSPAFLRVHRSLSLVWSTAFIAYAMLRVAIVYSASSVDQSIWLNEIPGVVAFGVGLLASARAGRRLAAIVEARLAETDPATTTPQARTIPAM
jgi:hypothetical protein